MSEWQPIETAPRGVMLLFADMNAEWVKLWAFCGWRHEGLSGNFVQMPDGTARSATHWTHIPQPPEVPRV